MRRAATLAFLAIGLFSAVRSALAVQPDAETIARITGQAPEVKNGIAKISVPRRDLSVRVDGVRLQPFQGLTTWAAFQGAGEKILVMGDVTMTEDEVNPALSAALEAGLEVTALHNHFFYEQPRIFFMHIAGTGTTDELAGAVQKVLDAVQAVGKQRTSGKEAQGFGATVIPAKSTLDPKPLEGILKAPGQAKDGMVKFVFGRTTRAHGAEIGETMGVNTWAVFAGSPEAAVVDGDVAMLEDELQDVLRALRKVGINIVAIHNHMTHENPRVVFLHYWGKGSATALAAGIRAALDTQRR